MKVHHLHSLPLKHVTMRTTVGVHESTREATWTSLASAWRDCLRQAEMSVTFPGSQRRLDMAVHTRSVAILQQLVKISAHHDG